MALAGCEALAEQIHEVVEEAMGSYGLTYPEVIGTLEMVKADVREAARCEEEADDEE